MAGRISLTIFGLIIGFLLIAYFTVNVIAIQPIGALPEGKTIVVTKLTNVKFIDSADAICERTAGGVSILCRGLVLARIAEESRILLRLPYNEQLYLLSTGGVKYGK